MKVGKMNRYRLETEYYKIDSKIINSDVWVLYENNNWGDAVKQIAVNLTKNYYTYTYETLDYTVENLELEFFDEIYSLAQ